MWGKTHKRNNLTHTHARTHTEVASKAVARIRKTGAKYRYLGSFRQGWPVVMWDKTHKGIISLTQAGVHGQPVARIQETGAEYRYLGSFTQGWPVVICGQKTQKKSHSHTHTHTRTHTVVARQAVARIFLDKRNGSRVQVLKASTHTQRWPVVQGKSKTHERNKRR